MIKLIITSIIIFIAIILLLLMLNVKIEYFSNNIFISKTYNILKDSSGNNINPKIWYKLDNTNFTDDEMGLVNLTNLRNCTPNTTDFIKGNASLQFTGRSSLESRPTTLFGDSTFSISVWVKLKNITNNFKCIASNRFEVLKGWSLYVAPSSGVFPDGSGASYSNTLNLWFGTGTPGVYSVAKFYPNFFPKYENVWTHIVVTSKKTGLRNNAESKCYINGEFISTITQTYDNTQNVRFCIGDISDRVNVDVQFPLDNGSLVDDFRYYNQILDENQVYELYTGYKKIGEVIDTSTNCVANMSSSGIIKRIPDTNFDITNISAINKINDYIFNQSFNNAGINYTLTFSRYLDNDYIPTNLLSRNNKLTIFYDSINRDNYDENGNYIGIFSKNTNIIPNLNNYPQKGDFIHIRLTSSSSSSFSNIPIKLKRYGFTADPQRPSRAPGTWALYAGTRLLEPSNTNKTLLVNNTTRLNNNSYCSANVHTYFHDISANETNANELLFIFTSLADFGNNNNSGGVLSFMNLLLFTS